MWTPLLGYEPCKCNFSTVDVSRLPKCIMQAWGLQVFHAKIACRLTFQKHAGSWKANARTSECSSGENKRYLNIDHVSGWASFDNTHTPCGYRCQPRPQPAGTAPAAGVGPHSQCPAWGHHHQATQQPESVVERRPVQVRGAPQMAGHRAEPHPRGALPLRERQQSVRLQQCGPHPPRAGS